MRSTREASRDEAFRRESLKDEHGIGGVEILLCLWYAQKVQQAVGHTVEANNRILTRTHLMFS